MEEDIRDLLATMTTRQIRALASQNGIEEWATDEISALKRRLVKISDTRDLFGEQE
jgi:hypothetical protein